MRFLAIVVHQTLVLVLFQNKKLDSPTIASIGEKLPSVPAAEASWNYQNSVSTGSGGRSRAPSHSKLANRRNSSGARTPMNSRNIKIDC
jgi:hypothetical protein